MNSESSASISAGRRLVTSILVNGADAGWGAEAGAVGAEVAGEVEEAEAEAEAETEEASAAVGPASLLKIGVISSSITLYLTLQGQLSRLAVEE